MRRDERQPKRHPPRNVTPAHITSFPRKWEPSDYRTARTHMGAAHTSTNARRTHMNADRTVTPSKAGTQRSASITSLPRRREPIRTRDTTSFPRKRESSDPQATRRNGRKTNPDRAVSCDYVAAAPFVPAGSGAPMLSAASGAPAPSAASSIPSAAFSMPIR